MVVQRLLKLACAMLSSWRQHHPRDSAIRRVRKPLHVTGTMELLHGPARPGDVRAEACRKFGHGQRLPRTESGKGETLRLGRRSAAAERSPLHAGERSGDVSEQMHRGLSRFHGLHTIPTIRLPTTVFVSHNHHRREDFAERGYASRSWHAAPLPRDARQQGPPRFICGSKGGQLARSPHRR